MIGAQTVPTLLVILLVVATLARGLSYCAQAIRDGRKAQASECSGWYHHDEDPTDVPYGWKVTPSLIPGRWKLTVGPWLNDGIPTPRVTMRLRSRDLADELGSAYARYVYDLKRSLAKP